MRDPQVTSRIMSRIRSKGGKAETLIGRTMWHYGLRYRKHYPIRGKPDYVFIRAKIAVFCDGDFWHGRDFPERLAAGRFKNNKEYWVKKITRNMERDIEITQELNEQGWLVMRFWESEIFNDADSIAKQVLQVYKERVNKSRIV